MRALLVVNPVATSTSVRTRDVLTAALETDLKLEVTATATRGHAAELAHQARVDGVDLVVALGGDGTVNEVVNGLLIDGPRDGIPALAVVPGGGTNVFARALGLPRDPVEATGALLSAIRAGRSRAIGLGQAGDRWFTFNAGMGWDASVVARVDRRRRKVPAERPPSSGDYVRAAVQEFFPSGQRRRPGLTIYRPGSAPLPGVHLAVVANTAPWTYLRDRPLLMSPDASFDTGLDLYALTRLRTVATLLEARRLITGRVRTTARQVHRLHDLSVITLTADRPTAAQVDGEYLGDVESLVLRSVPQALRVVV
ncbi:MAG: diacylglycerol kinase family lipid kinase [Sporichthyaceae bacterium]|nr:diacylglycerol kinase family lipid kinase [Sporichthyaceae bacterium]